MFDSSKIQPHIAFTDLREWMAEAEKLGELKTVRGASWQEEIGLATDVVVPPDDGPAVIFDEVPGCPKGFRVIINTFAGKRRAMTFGFPQGLTKQDLSDAYFAHYQTDAKHLAPVFVDNGPVFENIVQKDDIDIEKFPTPIWHRNDGGRYIGTGCYSVTMDPDEKWINAGCYRAMIQDKKSREPAHGARQAWLHAPAKIFSQRREDADRAGARRRSAVFLHGRHRASLRRLRVRCGRRHAPQAGGSACAARSPGCRFRPIPRSSSKVFSTTTTASSKDRSASGPVTTPRTRAPSRCLRSKRSITATIRSFSACRPSAAARTRWRATARSCARPCSNNELRNAGVPDVTQVWPHEIGASRMLVALAIKQRYPGHAKQVAMLASSCGASVYGLKMVIVVDDDIDVSNLDQLMWATLSRYDPETSVEIVKRMRSTPADPRLTPEQRKIRDFTNSRMIIDATRPFEWGDKFPKVNAPSQDVVRKAREMFGYLLK